ncbi:MAG: STAS domain-containing protein [Sporichthyaceae bacterium]
MSPEPQNAQRVPKRSGGQALFVLVGRDGTFVARGGLDVNTAPALRRVLETNPPRGLGRRLLDLRGVDYLDADGVTVLCEYARRLHFVVEPCSPVAAVVHAYGLDSPVAGVRAALS